MNKTKKLNSFVNIFPLFFTKTNTIQEITVAIIAVLDVDAKTPINETIINSNFIFDGFT